MAATKHDLEIMRGAWRKIDTMALSFGLPTFSDETTDEIVEKVFGGYLKDTLREVALKNTDTIEEMSIAELRIENRVVYHAIRAFRNSASVYFKFSTSSDGKSVDKSMIPKMIMNMLSEYDSEFVKWRRESTSGGSQLWNIVPTVATNGDFSTS